jgi:hypothetical protein
MERIYEHGLMDIWILQKIKMPGKHGRRKILELTTLGDQFMEDI